MSCKWGSHLLRQRTHFSKLTVGDGIVSQIPALLISTATGIVVTRASSKGSLGEDITGQLFAQAKSLYVAGGTIILLGLFTPIPDWITLPIGIALIAGAYMMGRKKPEDEEELLEIEEEVATDGMKSPENVVNLLNVDPIEFEFGYGLIPLVDLCPRRRFIRSCNYDSSSASIGIRNSDSSCSYS